MSGSSNASESEKKPPNLNLTSQIYLDQETTETDSKVSESDSNNPQSDNLQHSPLQNTYQEELTKNLTKEQQYIKGKYDQLLKYYSKNKETPPSTRCTFFWLFPVLLYENLMNKNKISKIFSEIQNYIFPDEDVNEMDVNMFSRLLFVQYCTGFIMNDVEKNYLSVKTPEIKNDVDRKIHHYLLKVLFSSFPTILIDYNTLLKENIMLLEKIKKDIDKEQNFILFNIKTGKLQKIEQNIDFNFDVLVDKIKITFGEKEIVYPRNVTKDDEKQIKKFLVKNIVYNVTKDDEKQIKKFLMKNIVYNDYNFESIFVFDWLAEISEKMVNGLNKSNQDSNIDNFFKNNPHLIGYDSHFHIDIQEIKKTLYTIYTLFDDEIKQKHLGKLVQNLQKIKTTYST